MNDDDKGQMDRIVKDIWGDQYIDREDIETARKRTLAEEVAGVIEDAMHKYDEANTPHIVSGVYMSEYIAGVLIDRGYIKHG